MHLVLEEYRSAQHFGLSFKALGLGIIILSSTTTQCNVSADCVFKGFINGTKNFSKGEATNDETRHGINIIQKLGVIDQEATGVNGVVSELTRRFCSEET